MCETSLPIGKTGEFSKGSIGRPENGTIFFSTGWGSSVYQLFCNRTAWSFFFWWTSLTVWTFGLSRKLQKHVQPTFLQIIDVLRILSPTTKNSTLPTSNDNPRGTWAQFSAAPTNHFELWEGKGTKLISRNNSSFTKIRWCLFTYIYHTNPPFM